MEITILGPIHATHGHDDVTPTGVRQRRALVALAVAGREGAGADRLAEVIWDDGDRPAEYGAHLRTAINRLRRQLRPDDSTPDPIATLPGGYRLDPAVVSVDLWEFEADVEAADGELCLLYTSDAADERG